MPPTRVVPTPTPALTPTPTVSEVLAELAQLGSESIKKVLVKHGAREPFYGVKVEHLKKIQKRIQANQPLALELYDSGISDAMYLAGLIAEPAKFTKPQLTKWVKGAYWSLLSGSTVPWVTAESPFATELALKWMPSKVEGIASAGWATYSSYVSITPDDQLDLDQIEALLTTVEENIHDAANRVRYCMNGFVIAVGCYVVPLIDRAKAVATAIGDVSVDMGETACEVPLATDYIAKVEARGKLGVKRKSARC